MKLSMLSLLGLSMVVVGTGCSSSVVRSASSPAAASPTSEPAPLVAAAPRLDARIMPGEYEMVWTAPEAHAAPATNVSTAVRPESISKKGKLIVGDLHTLSMQ